MVWATGCVIILPVPCCRASLSRGVAKLCFSSPRMLHMIRTSWLLHFRVRLLKHYLQFTKVTIYAMQRSLPFRGSTCWVNDCEYPVYQRGLGVLYWRVHTPFHFAHLIPPCYPLSCCAYALEYLMPQALHSL